jgi:AcrR family transcriptional regulator
MDSLEKSNTGRKSAYVARNRLALLKATQIVLAEHGPSATIEMVAEAAEIAVSTIYKHFDHKEVLFETALISAMKEWEEWALGTLAEVSDPYERLVFPLRLQAKLRVTHPVFANILAHNTADFIKAVPLANFGIERAAMDLQAAQIIDAENIDVRMQNLVKIITLTMVEMCSDMEMTEENALLRFSIGLEMLGLPPKKIKSLFSAPLPDISQSLS